MRTDDVRLLGYAAVTAADSGRRRSTTVDRGRNDVNVVVVKQFAL